MKNFYIATMVLAICFSVCFITGTAGAQGETAATQVATPEESYEYSYGAVKSVSPSQIVISEYDYTKDQEIDVIYAVDAETTFENVDSTANIAIGEIVDVEYTVKDGKNIARTVIVEKLPEEEGAYPEEGAAEPEMQEGAVEPVVTEATETPAQPEPSTKETEETESVY